MQSETIEVLLVEDNAADVRLLLESLKEYGGPDRFHVTPVSRLRDAREAVTGAMPHAILLDLSLPDSSGLDSIDRLRQAAPDVPIVVLTALQNEALALQALRWGVQDYLVKGQCEGALPARALRYAVERKRAEAVLREREERLRAIVATAVDAIITIDEDGTIESVNPAVERLFGYSASELLGQNVKILMPEPYRSEHDGYLRSYLRTGTAKIIGIGREVSGRRKDGTSFPLSLAVSEMRIDRRRMFTGIVHDLTNRRQLERQVLETATAEQRRIGHDLHDGLCQELVSLSLGLELLERRLASSGLSAKATGIDKLAESLQAITTQARQLAHGLNPVDVEGGGLPGALEQLAVRITQSTSIKCRFHWDGRAYAPDAAVATNLYRIAQEAVGNAIKHGKPSRIDLHLSRAEGEMTLRIADNGRGLRDVSSHQTAETSTPHDHPLHLAGPRAAGIGLQTMNYRARLIGGTFDIRPAAPGSSGGNGSGTVVTCSVRYYDRSPARSSAAAVSVAAADRIAAPRNASLPPPPALADTPTTSPTTAPSQHRRRHEGRSTKSRHGGRR